MFKYMERLLSCTEQNHTLHECVINEKQIRKNDIYIHIIIRKGKYNYIYHI